MHILHALIWDTETCKNQFKKDEGGLEVCLKWQSKCFACRSSEFIPETIKREKEREKNRERKKEGRRREKRRRKRRRGRTMEEMNKTGIIVCT
jgi:hypothetical protein